MVKAWLMDTKLEHEEVNMGRQIVVSVILVRNTFGVIMVTYVPTLLMNIINQVTSHHTNPKLVSIYEATTYIRLVEKYELIVTVNITCMMVLTSVYLSVANSLPATLRTEYTAGELFLNTILRQQGQMHIRRGRKPCHIYIVWVKCAKARNATASKTTDNFSLISSISIKPIEIWLLCNLAYPFIIIIVNIMIQVTRSPIKS